MYYSRIAATFARVFPDIGAPLVKRLRGAFHFHAKRKDQSAYRLAHKLRNVKYLAELTKFRVAPPIVAFGCLRQLLRDFQHHNIEIAATLLEGCGRFLYRQPETHSRCKELLDIMMRLKNAKNVDESIGYMVDNACVPPCLLCTFCLWFVLLSVRPFRFVASSLPLPSLLPSPQLLALRPAPEVDEDRRHDRPAAAPVHYPHLCAEADAGGKRARKK